MSCYKIQRNQNTLFVSGKLNFDLAQTFYLECNHIINSHLIKCIDTTELQTNSTLLAIIVEIKRTHPEIKWEVHADFKKVIDLTHSRFLI